MELVGSLTAGWGMEHSLSGRNSYHAHDVGVTEMDKTELNDVMQAASLLKKSGGSGCRERTNAQIDAISRAVLAMGDCIARNESVLDADMAFHMAVSDAAGNPLLSNSLQMLRNLMRHGSVQTPAPGVFLRFRGPSGDLPGHPET